MHITKIDKNFALDTKIEREGLTFFDVKEEPFKIYGVFYENGEFVRMPDKVASSVSEGVRFGSKRTAGGRVRFITDSPYVAISAVQMGSAGFSHMAASGEAGFDLYESRDGKEVYVKSFVPPHNALGGYENVIDLSTSEERLFTINFPLYFNVKELYVGIKAGSVLKAAPEYSIKTPIVYYGSSITQGGCASRPGNSYQGFLSRWYDADYINLGFSGSARGENTMAEYVKGLKMSCFVYDYDHNAPDVEHLRRTHEPFYKTVREAHPDIPVIFMSRPRVDLTEDEKKRRDVVFDTYSKALSRGENVYHIFGSDLMELCGDEGTVDGCHPTDLGFYSMALRIKREMDKFIDTLR